MIHDTIHCVACGAEGRQVLAAEHPVGSHVEYLSSHQCCDNQITVAVATFVLESTRSVFLSSLFERYYIIRHLQWAC